MAPLAAFLLRQVQRNHSSHQVPGTYDNVNHQYLISAGEDFQAQFWCLSYHSPLTMHFSKSVDMIQGKMCKGEYWTNHANFHLS